MKLMTFFIGLFILQPFLQAQVILVPEKSYPLDIYLSKCKQTGYLCTQDYFKSQILQQPTLKFDLFLEKIDLYNEDFRKNSYAEIKTILMTEHLDIDQAELIINILTKQNSIQSQPQLLALKYNLREIIQDLKNLPDDKSESESYIIFKKVLTKSQYLKIKYKTHFFKVAYITPYTDPFNSVDDNPYLISGDCENLIVSPQLNQRPDMHFTPLFNGSCKKTELFTQSSMDTKNFWSEYKKPIIYTAVSAAAIFFLSQYQMQIEY